MDRRELIKIVSLATGSMLSAPLLGSLLVSCKEDLSKNEIGNNLFFFDQEDFSKLKEVIDIILPKTDSPSATEVGVHQTIDVMVGTIYDASAQKNYLDQFNALMKYLNASSTIDVDVLATLSKSEKKSETMAKKGLLDLKQQTLAYYLSTEEIGTNFLNYLPVPGAYEACISLESVNGKAWAL